MITFKEFEEVWDESRVLSDIVRVLSLAEEKNYIEVKVYENIGGIDISSSVRLDAEDKKDVVDLLSKIMARKLSRLREQGSIFTKNTKNQKLPPKNDNRPLKLRIRGCTRRKNMSNQLQTQNKRDISTDTSAWTFQDIKRYYDHKIC